MKKFLSFFALTALCMGFVACEDGVEESNAQPQTNPQEAIFNAADLNVSAPVSSALNLAALNDAAQSAQVATYTIANLPENCTLALTAQLAKDDTFAGAKEVAAAIDENGNITLPADELQGFYYGNVSKDPKAGKIAIRYIANIVNGSQIVRVGGPDYFVGAGELNVLPFPAEMVIEDAYYLVGTASNGAITGGIKLDHSSASPYDDPKFTTVVEISDAQAAEGYTWAIVPASAVEGGQAIAYGVAEEGLSDTEGSLTEAAFDEVFFGYLYESGPFMLTVNMEAKTFEWMLAIENLWTPGNTNGWSQAASQLLYTEDYTNYMGFAHLNGDFKFSTKPDWTGKNLGPTGVEGELTTDGGAGNLTAPADALYWCKVNLTELTYTITKIESLGLIGGFNGWGSQAALEPSGDFLIWTGTVAMTAGDEFKFRMNDDWGINLGGSLDDLRWDKGNLKCDATGTYVVTLNLTSLPYTATITLQDEQ